MRYTLSYDRDCAKYQVSCGDQVEEFMHVNRLWTWIGNTLEPGDLLEWIR